MPAKVVSEAPAKKEVKEPKVEQPKPSAAEPKKSEVAASMEKISTYNGDSTDKYNWSQTVFDVQVQIPLPEGTKAN